MITEGAMQEFKFRHQSRQVNDFLRDLTEPLFVADKEGLILWANESFQRVFSLPATEKAPAASFLSYVHPESQERLRHDLAVLCSGRTPLTREICLWAENAWLNFALDIYPATDCCYCLARDITRQKTYEEEKLQLLSVAEASLDAIYALDTDGHIRSWNRAAVAIFGYTAEEAIGCNVEILALPGQKEEIDAVIQLIRQGASYGYETVRQRKNHELVSLFITIAPIRDSHGVLLGASVVARDITALQKQKLEMSRLDRLNTFAELASVISHEVRNPMTTIGGFLQMLQKKTRDKKQLEYFSIMSEELKRVNAILGEFITIGRTKEVKQEKQTLKSIIYSMAPLLEADAAYQGKIIKFSLKDTCATFVNANEIRQLVLNLMRNGLEAMEANGILQIKTSSKDNKVILAVKDDGHGIAEEHLEKLGTAFFSTKETGTGLGLYVCYEIVQRNNATLNVLTGADGTTFMVTFPAAG
ncbi:MAG: PAS domain S-box protein [Gracilibacteraceae bacterium]|jgi:PAS domain S-box-containing protein|nr:PAS domain S-box protein [Gracilibacteraceae bacterium]